MRGAPTTVSKYEYIYINQTRLIKLFQNVIISIEVVELIDDKKHNNDCSKYNWTHEEMLF